MLQKHTLLLIKSHLNSFIFFKNTFDSIFLTQFVICLHCLFLTFSLSRVLLRHYFMALFAITHVPIGVNIMNCMLFIPMLDFCASSQAPEKQPHFTSLADLKIKLNSITSSVFISKIIQLIHNEKASAL